MRRTVIVIPNLLAQSPEDSPLSQKLETLRVMTELGEITRLTAMPNLETPEAIWLGMNPNEGQLRQGPLTVAALGQDPPERSTHFHVSLLGLADGKIVQPPSIVASEDLQQILDRAKKLNTKNLTFLNGENVDHALVWENVGDLHTVPPLKAVGQSIKPSLPEGDAEKELRRFIDDSINLLTELELNERRIDEGLPPLNLLWPWGEGVRKSVPNLLLKRGERAHLESNSMRLAGLTRLVGYRHGDRHAFGQSINTKLTRLAEIASKNDPTIIVIDAPAELRSKGLEEELHWFIKELDEKLLKPLFEKALTDRSRLIIVGPGDTPGLALRFETGMHNSNPFPFDERSLEEKALPMRDAWAVIEQGLKTLSAL